MPEVPRVPRKLLNTEDQLDGEESQEAQIFEGSGKKGRPRHEEAQIRHAEERPIGKEGKEQETGDRDRAVRSPKERGQGAEEAFEEKLEELVARRRAARFQADQPIRKYKATLGRAEIQGGHCVLGYNGCAPVTAAENS
jgi:hypothetical protein